MPGPHAAERIELAALTDVYTVAATPGVSATVFGAATLLLCEHGGPLSNRLVAGGNGGSLRSEDLDAAIAFADRRRAAWAISVGPDYPDGFEAELAARGFRPGYAWMKFARGVDRLPQVQTSLDVRLATREDAAAFARLVTVQFQLDPAIQTNLAALPERAGWRCFLAWDGPTPVAAGACFVQGESAWFGFGATVPSHRRWGAQSALLAARIGAAAELGATQLFVETGKRAAGRPDQSYRNILRAGFRETYLRPNFLCPGFASLAREPSVAHAASRIG